MTTLFAPSIDMPAQSYSLVRDVLSLTKARLSFLVIFTCALGIFLAPASVSFTVAMVSMIATSGLVAGACIINCVMEKDIDAQMERTKYRPLPAGRIKPQTATLLGIGLITLCLAALFFVVNPLTAVLGLIATITYVFLYTPMKQKTAWALFAGAVPGAIPPLMGWTTVTNEMSVFGWVLFGILFVWQLPHFLSISIYHADDYKKAGLKIFPDSLTLKTVIHKIVIYTFLLMGVTALPYFLGYNGLEYLVFTMVIGALFSMLALWGYNFETNKPELLKWSRRYFYSTLLYLPCIFTAMLLLK
ncbi:MAG: heme o synthase [Proteobacteria bacterium]|nr:heme o synthase [Pseudomonadota bacterium]